MDIMGFMNEYVVAAVVIACLCVGYVLKHCVPSDKVNKYIPLIVAVLGVVVNCWVNEWSFTPEILVAGLVSGLASTGRHQAFKQIIEKSAE